MEKMEKSNNNSKPNKISKKGKKTKNGVDKHFEILFNNIFDCNLKQEKIIKEEIDENEISELKNIITNINWTKINILNNSIEIIKLNNKYEDECKEILSILKKPIIDKNNSELNNPFKPLSKPKKLSLKGKVILSDYQLNNINNQN